MQTTSEAYTDQGGDEVNIVRYGFNDYAAKATQENYFRQTGTKPLAKKEEVEELLSDSGFNKYQFIKDYSMIDRIVEISL